MTQGRNWYGFVLLVGLVCSGCDEPGTLGEHVAASGVVCGDAVLVGNYTVEDSSDLAMLDGYAEIDGSLTIQHTDFTQLHGTDCLKRITGDLRFSDNPLLETVTGFDGLTTIGGSIEFEEEDGFDAVSGFNGLTSLGGDLYVYSYGTHTISGFEELRDIFGSVSFGGGTFVIEVFDELERLHGSLSGGEMGSVTINGMNDLSTLGGFHFVEAGSVDTAGLIDLEEILGDVIFIYCGWFRTEGLSDLSVIHGNVRFLGVYLHPNVTAGFQELEHIGGNLSINSSGASGFFEELGGFDELESIGGSLIINEQNQRVLGGFDDLESIGGSLVIRWSGIDEIVGLADLVDVGGSVEIKYNEDLYELGLSDLVTVGGDLDISYNDVLPSCDANDLYEDLLDNGFSGAATITGNGGDCD